MLFSRVNLEQKLLAKRKQSQSEAVLLEEVGMILAENELERKHITKKLKTKSKAVSNAFQFDLLETDKIFHLEQIKAICVDYRLRFLESSLFKNHIPEEAITKVRLLEKEHQTHLEGFKIIAPSKAFHLLNYDDPMLFAPIGNDYYYLIHKWGTEIHPLRKLMVLPVRNLWNFTLMSIIVSLLITFLVPANDLSRTVPLARVIIFLFAFKSIFAVLAYYFFMMGKNFNEEIWQRQYYNN